MPGTRKLGRKTDCRMSMLQGMVTYLIEHGQIETTYYRAKEVSALAEKIITIAKTNNLTAKRRVLSLLKKEAVVYFLFDTVAPLYKDRKGGYTSVIKAGPRRGDGAEMAIIRLLDTGDIYKELTDKEKKQIEKEEKKKAKEEAKAE